MASPRPELEQGVGRSVRFSPARRNCTPPSESEDCTGEVPEFKLRFFNRSAPHELSTFLSGMHQGTSLRVHTVRTGTSCPCLPVASYHSLSPQSIHAISNRFYPTRPPHRSPAGPDKRRATIGSRQPASIRCRPQQLSQTHQSNPSINASNPY